MNAGAATLSDLTVRATEQPAQRQPAVDRHSLRPMQTLPIQQAGRRYLLRDHPGAEQLKRAALAMSCTP
jgi:hypothetical protein